MELKKATFILSYSKICLLKHIERSQLLRLLGNSHLIIKQSTIRESIRSAHFSDWNSWKISGCFVFIPPVSLQLKINMS